MRQRKRSTTGQGDERNEAGSEPRQRKRSNEELSRDGSVRRTDAGDSPLKQARDQRDPPSSGKPRSDTSWIKPHGAHDGKSDGGQSYGTAEDVASVARTSSGGSKQDRRRSSVGADSEVDEQVVARKQKMVEEQLRALMQQKEGLDDLANLMRQEKARKKEKKNRIFRLLWAEKLLKMLLLKWIC